MYENVDLSVEQSTNQFYTRFWAVNELARDEVRHSECCLLVVTNLARLSRLCRGWPRPCSRRLPARRADSLFSQNIFHDVKYLCVYISVLECVCFRSTFRIPVELFFSWAVFLNVFIGLALPCVVYKYVGRDILYLVLCTWYTWYIFICITDSCCSVLLYCCWFCSSSIAAASSCCCLSSFAGWQNLLLVHWIWFQCFVLFIQTRFTPSQYYRIYGLDLPTSYR